MKILMVLTQLITLVCTLIITYGTYSVWGDMDILYRSFFGISVLILVVLNIRGTFLLYHVIKEEE